MAFTFSILNFWESKFMLHISVPNFTWFGFVFFHITFGGLPTFKFRNTGNVTMPVPEVTLIDMGELISAKPQPNTTKREQCAQCYGVYRGHSMWAAESALTLLGTWKPLSIAFILYQSVMQTAFCLRYVLSLPMYSWVSDKNNVSCFEMHYLANRLGGNCALRLCGNHYFYSGHAITLSKRRSAWLDID